MAARWIRRVAWLLGIAAVGYFVIGAYLYELPVGLDWSADPGGVALHRLLNALGVDPPHAFSGLIWLVAAAVVLLVVVGVAARRANADADPGRRRLLTSGAVVGAAALAGGAAMLRAFMGLGRKDVGWGPVHEGIQAARVQTTSPRYPDAWKGARVQAYRTLGRTGWRISDIVVGSGHVRGEKGSRVVREAIERGVTYVDTAPDYSATGSEQAVGEALKGVRDQVFLATKFCTPYGHLPAGTPVADYKRAIEQSLRRLETDHVDLVHVHSCDDVDRLLDDNAHEAFERLKEEGKARFLGFSTHTPNLVQVVEAGIASGRFDVMMLAYHHGIWPQLDQLIHKGRTEQDMGVVAMKTLKGAKQNGLAGFRDQASSFAQSALRWVLSNPDVSAAIISFYEPQHVDEYLRASGGKVTPAHVAVLEEYDRQIRGTYCGPHCGACLEHCPAGLPIHDVLRYRMYFEDYGDEKEAMRLYRRLERDASACVGCPAPCAGACPVGISIQDRMLGAHDLLTLG